MNQTSKNAVVTIVLGTTYGCLYNRYFKASHERFARSIGADLIIIRDYIVPTTKHPSWQKMVMFRHEAVQKYDRVLFVDADIYIQRDAKNPFDMVPRGQWGMVKNNEYDIPAIAESDLTLYSHCPTQPSHPSFVLNGGFFVAEKAVHQKVFEYIFDHYPEEDCYEQGPLSYHFLTGFSGTTFLGTILPGNYNGVLAAYRQKYGRGLSVIVRFFRENQFIHFAGGMNFLLISILMELDMAPQGFASKTINFFSSHYFDWLTGFLLRGYTFGTIVKRRIIRRT